MDKQSISTESDSGKSGRGDLSLTELFDMFPDDKAAMEWFEKNIWPEGRRCPRCGNRYTCTIRHPQMPYYCSECRKYFSVKNRDGHGALQDQLSELGHSHLPAGHPPQGRIEHAAAPRPGDQAEFGVVPAAQAEGVVVHLGWAGPEM